MMTVLLRYAHVCGFFSPTEPEPVLGLVARFSVGATKHMKGLTVVRCTSCCCISVAFWASLQKSVKRALCVTSLFLRFESVNRRALLFPNCYIKTFPALPNLFFFSFAFLFLFAFMSLPLHASLEMD